MQAPTWTKRFDPGQIKLLLIALAAITILLIGAVLSTTLSSGNDRAATVDRAQGNEVAPLTSNARFLGWNTLPGDPGTYPVTSQQEHRFRDWNVLPGDPGTQPATSLREYRFRDWNVLPGDNTRLVPPDPERGIRH